MQVMPSGNELHVVRARTPVIFECNAAAQPRPRIRWFRLVPTGGAAGVTTLGTAATIRAGSNTRQQQQSRHQLIGPHQSAAASSVKFDETQLRSILLRHQQAQQVGDELESMAAPLGGAEALIMQRIELQPTTIGMTTTGKFDSEHLTTDVIRFVYLTDQYQYQHLCN